jgi:hypothetical protein
MRHAMMRVWAVPAAPPGYDSDAQDYIDRVEAADAASLETAVKDAINALVLDLKTTVTHRSVDITVWDKLAWLFPSVAARSLEGVYENLKPGTADAVNNGVVLADYNRKTGVMGAVSPAKVLYISTSGINRDDAAFGCYVSEAPTNSGGHLVSNANTASAAGLAITTDATNALIRHGSATNTAMGARGSTSGLVGATRWNSTEYEYLWQGSVTGVTNTSTNTRSSLYWLSRNATLANPTNARLCFVFYGNDLPLGTLNTYCNDFVTAINAAI